MLIDDYNRTIDLWIDELSKYSFAELLIKPGTESWSLGQVFMHLLNESIFYVEEIKKCLGSHEDPEKTMTASAKQMFADNAFPDLAIKGDSEVTAKIKQPSGKEEIQKVMLAVQSEMNELWNSVVNDKGQGKTRHPGLGYFNAIEWFQFAEMHWRHHLRQKSRVEAFINGIGKT